MLQSLAQTSVWSRQPACQVLFSRGSVSGTGTVAACYSLSRLNQVSQAAGDTVAKLLQTNPVKRSQRLLNTVSFKVQSASHTQLHSLQ